jgi:hypothetical protein
VSFLLAEKLDRLTAVCSSIFVLVSVSRSISTIGYSLFITINELMAGTRHLHREIKKSRQESFIGLPRGCQRECINHEKCKFQLELIGNESRESIESHSQTVASESVLSRKHEIVERARRWITMNENTLRCVIKKNSNMNNSLIIGEGFFLLYLSRHMGLFSRLPANARSAWLRSAFSSRVFRKRRPEGIFPFLPCTSILAHLSPHARVQSTFFFFASHPSRFLLQLCTL